MGSARATLIEVGPLFELQYASSGFSYSRELIRAGTRTVAVRSIRNDGSLTTRYLTYDHLGSVSEITNEVGGVDERMSYDAFGARRDPASWGPLCSSASLTDITDKGYTDQQQLDAVALVHMNGRVYDPTIGRFISADPIVPDPLDSQAFNRYSYVYNNPLSAIDPSGFDPGGFDSSGYVYLEPPPTIVTCDVCDISVVQQMPAWAYNPNYIYFSPSNIPAAPIAPPPPPSPPGNQGGNSDPGSGSQGSGANYPPVGDPPRVTSITLDSSPGGGYCNLGCTREYNPDTAIRNEGMGGGKRFQTPGNPAGETTGSGTIKNYVLRHGSVDISAEFFILAGSVSIDREGVTFTGLYGPGFGADLNVTGTVNLLNDPKGLSGGVLLSGGSVVGGQVFVGAGQNGPLLQVSGGYNVGFSAMGVAGYTTGSFAWQQVINGVWNFLTSPVSPNLMNGVKPMYH